MATLFTDLPPLTAQYEIFFFFLISVSIIGGDKLLVSYEQGVTYNFSPFHTWELFQLAIISFILWTLSCDLGVTL